MGNRQIIIHVDMDAFYASVEVRDDPRLAGKPLIIGSLPTERGVVATCSYEARKYGVHSAMNIKEAYRLCPHGICMHPNFDKYSKVSAQLREIWNDYAVRMETVRLLDQVEKRPVRLVGAGIYNLSGDEGRQMTLDDYMEEPAAEKQQIIDQRLRELQERYGLDFAGRGRGKSQT